MLYNMDNYMLTGIHPQKFTQNQGSTNTYDWPTPANN